MNADTFLRSIDISPDDPRRTGFEILMARGAHLPVSHMAYVLATAMLETAGSMQPVKETVMPWHKDRNPSDKTVIGRLNRAKAKGQLKRDYWSGGFFGRGYVQLTHHRNYAAMSSIVGVDLVADPTVALHPETAATIMIAGMERGLFTGSRMSQYLPGDYVNARRVVNGLDRAEEIAATATRYEKALRNAGWGAPQGTQEPRKAPAKGAGPAKGLAALVGALIAAIASLFRRSK